MKQAIIKTDTEQGLDQIHRPGVAAVILQKSNPQALERLIDWMPAHMFGVMSADEIAPQDEVDAITEQMMRISNSFDISHMQPLANHLLYTVGLFRKFTGAKTADVKLVLTDNQSDAFLNSAKAFHTDNGDITIRLIATLRGPGTEYLTSPLTNQSENKPFYKGDAPHVKSMQEGHIMLLKGRDYDPLQQRQETLLYHRAPDLDPDTKKRLFLLIEGESSEINEHARKWRKSFNSKGLTP